MQDSFLPPALNTLIKQAFAGDLNAQNRLGDLYQGQNVDDLAFDAPVFTPQAYEAEGERYE